MENEKYGSLKDKLAYLGSSLIPGGLLMQKKYTRRTGGILASELTMPVYLIGLGLHSVITPGVLVGSMFCAGASIHNKSLNPKEWPAIQEQRKLNYEQQFQQSSYESFMKADTDSSGTLSRKEFMNYLRNN